MRMVLMCGAVAIGMVGAAEQPAKLPALPDEEGFAGTFAGTSNGALLVAGGANFPDKKPWEGGTKVWSGTVFVLDRPDGEWRTAGKLPRPLGYGVSISHGPGVVCVGGADATRHYADAFRLEWKDGKLVTTALPPLPKPVAYGCGAIVGNTLYVAGGQEKPDSSALAAAWAFDLSAAEPKWKELDPMPGGGRILALAAGYDGAFWVIGGAELLTNAGKLSRRYRKDAYRYDPRTGWKRVADLPHPVAAAPSPAPTDAAGFFVLGGDDGAQVEVAPDKHRGFRKDMLHYDAKADRWTDAGKHAAPRVTVPCVRWGDVWVLPSGEARPGVRSPEVWSYTLTRKE